MKWLFDAESCRGSSGKCMPKRRLWSLSSSSQSRLHLSGKGANRSQRGDRRASTGGPLKWLWRRKHCKAAVIRSVLRTLHCRDAYKVSFQRLSVLCVCPVKCCFPAPRPPLPSLLYSRTPEGEPAWWYRLSIAWTACQVTLIGSWWEGYHFNEGKAKMQNFLSAVNKPKGIQRCLFSSISQQNTASASPLLSAPGGEPNRKSSGWTS